MNEQDLQAIKDGLEAGVITPEQAQQCIEIIKKRQADNEIEELRKENKELRKEVVLGLRKIADLAYYSARNDYRGAIRDIYDIASKLLEKE